MKQHFPGFYTYTEQEQKDLIDKSTIVFGASVLLDLLKISYGNVFLDIVNEKIEKERLWLPYDTAWLYHERLAIVVDEQVKNVDSAATALNRLKDSFSDNGQHPYIHDTLKVDFYEMINKIKDALDEDRSFLLGHLNNSTLRSRIDELFQGRIGEPYEQNQLEQLYQESEERHKQRRHPSIDFSRSKNTRIRHHRLIVWKQIERYAKESKKPIVLVLNRITPNWFFIYNDAMVRPHQNLINEFIEDTKQNIYIITAHELIDKLTPQKTSDVNNLLAQLKNKPNFTFNQQTDLEDNIATAL
ncbi:hypothetical protein SAMN04487827_2232 [Prevotella sp. khp7]|uniref:PIN-like domain-containing protein n=1 Tax=Prevotella sp. khp7 TaxID=1761885 RepID=UPI0008D67B7F|nr:PIN-like domain-containing protein [Prevotella sp. khp7]SEW23546.1 hypothetical protein SAMN04487827_2232 [Prevotella sp. khp7]